MRQNPKSAVAKSCAQDQLYENHRREPDAQRPQLGAARVVELRKVALPPIAGEHCEADERDEKYLRDCGMNRGDHRSMAQFYASGAEKRLSDDKRKGDPAPPPRRSA